MVSTSSYTIRTLTDPVIAISTHDHHKDTFLAATTHGITFFDTNTRRPKGQKHACIQQKRNKIPQQQQQQKGSDAAKEKENQKQIIHAILQQQEIIIQYRNGDTIAYDADRVTQCGEQEYIIDRDMLLRSPHKWKIESRGYTLCKTRINGQLVASQDEDTSTAMLVDTRSMQTVYKTPSHPHGTLLDMTFMQEGKLSLVCAYDDGHVVTYDRRGGIKAYKAHPEPVMAIASSQQSIFSVSPCPQLASIDRNRDSVHTISMQEGANMLTLRSDEAMLGITSMDSTIYCFEPRELTLKLSLPSDLLKVTSLSFGGLSRLYAGGGNGHIKVWEI